MPRPMWKGAISFGLVNIPVSLTPAVRSTDVRFHLYHDADGGRIREQRVCEIDGEKVSYEHVVKGYALTKQKVVTITKEELKAVDPKADKTIGIETFVKLVEIDPVFFERSYYLTPDARADKAYGLLAAALASTGLVALGRIVLSTRQHICMIRLAKNVLQLTTLAYSDELVDAPKVARPSAGKKELEMAEALIAQLTAPFKPKDFTNDYSDRVHALIEKKAKGKTIDVPETPKAEKTTDLADALERSLTTMTGATAKAPRHARPTRARRRPAATRKAASAR